MQAVQHCLCGDMASPPAAHAKREKERKCDSERENQKVRGGGRRRVQGTRSQDPRDPRGSKGGRDGTHRAQQQASRVAVAKHACTPCLLSFVSSPPLVLSCLREQCVCVCVAASSGPLPCMIAFGSVCVLCDAAKSVREREEGKKERRGDSMSSREGDPHALSPVLRHDT